MKKNILFLCFGIAFQWLWATPYFEWSPKTKKAYQKVINLRFMEARSLLHQVKTEEPDNYMIYLVANYIDFFTIYINEDKEEFKRLEKNKGIRLDKIKKGTRHSPYYLYLQAVIRLQWAAARLKFEEYTTAFFEAQKAFKLLSKNVEHFPNFMPNKKDLGMMHAMVGAIPGEYKWAVEAITSFEGTLEQGYAELEEVLEYAAHNDFLFEDETYVLYAYLSLYWGNDQKKTFDLLTKCQLDPAINPLGTFIFANIAMRVGNTDKAIDLLQHRPKGRAFHPFYYLDYMLGIAKLNRLDKDADIYLKKYVNNFTGNNFIKDSYRRLAWHALLNQRPQDYAPYMEAVKTKGHKIVGSDENALKEAKSGEVPQLTLLKVRLLFDGGYYRKAVELLDLAQEGDFSTKKDQLERIYRIGRLRHQMKEYDLAIANYQQTIERGRYESWYFACRAALEMGKIYEILSETIKAKAAYHLCTQIRPDEYRLGLHQQAKAGLSRLK